MDLILKRIAFRKDGIFSNLLDDQGNVVFATLEHAYRNKDGTYSPKIPDGTYQCIRGMHRLEGMPDDFETFEITGIDGHSNILFHIGNFNEDSEGCVLVGSAIKQSANYWIISNSRVAFTNFISLELGQDVFTLVVTSI